MIPGLTTRKWSRGPALQNTGSKDIPDLLIVLDASGSMEQAKINGDSTPLHIARLAAFSILNTYTQLAANTAGIIFSDRYRSADWNRDQSQLRELLVSQAGGNTVFPVARTTALVQQTTTKKAVIILTDGELHNRTAAMPALAALLEQGHKIMIYMINANPFDPAPYEHYLSAGGVIQVVKSPDDICSETWEQIG